jgi:hypothetical protein
MHKLTPKFILSHTKACHAAHDINLTEFERILREIDRVGQNKTNGI